MIPTPWLLIPVLSLLAYAGVMTYLYKDVVDDYANFRADMAAIQKQAESDAAAQQLRSEKVTADVSLAWAAALDAARRPVVRVQSATCNYLPESGTLPVAPTKHDGLQAGSGESWITEAVCEQIANDSILDREWVENAKKFVTEQHEASK